MKTLSRHWNGKVTLRDGGKFAGKPIERTRIERTDNGFTRKVKLTHCPHCGASYEG